MKTGRLRSHDDRYVLRYEDVAEPKIDSDEVLMRRGPLG